MKTNNSSFDENQVLHRLKHYLPDQAPLKDFIHHNSLHAFQHLKFHTALHTASEIFGYKTSFSLEEYRSLYHSNKIRKDILEKIISEKCNADRVQNTVSVEKEWLNKLLSKNFETPPLPRVGRLRENWKKQYEIDLDLFVHPPIFRTLCSYLDQGISIWNFPVSDKGFLSSIKEIEQHSFVSFFKTERARSLLLKDFAFSKGETFIEHLLKILVGDETLYEQYLFDQQFAHQGWSGMVSTVEDFPNGLLDTKNISLKDAIIFELLLEIDALDNHFGENWQPLGSPNLQGFKNLEGLNKNKNIFSEIQETELNEVLAIWQDAYEWTYYDRVLAGITTPPDLPKGEEIVKKNNMTNALQTPLPFGEGKGGETSFQALFCIDDRECSLKRYLEKFDTNCKTFGTPGFFNVEFFFKPKQGKSYTKLCPQPITPKYLIKEVGAKEKRKKDFLFFKTTNSLFRGWVISQTLGFWSAFQLFVNVFRPSITPAATSSFKLMDKFTELTIENKTPTPDPSQKEGKFEDATTTSSPLGRSGGVPLQIGFTIEEMADRVEGLLKSIGLIKDFAPLVYVIGHGASSVNNTYYAGYDCGACCGRPGSVNAKVFSFMANHLKVREKLNSRGLIIPSETQFVGGLHDTTRDEIIFYEEFSISLENLHHHHKNTTVFNNALRANSRERARRFESINCNTNSKKIHQKVKRRSVSLFEPRPEYNHATNALCIVGGRHLTRNLFLDRRAFTNSYDYKIDPEGKLLFSVMKPLGPVCGGINLEYFFSRVDNQKLGAGTKLPHNVMGLFGVANGTDGDLRPGLPSQMIEIHDPVRLMIIVEHFPEIVLNTIKSSDAVYEWFINEWIHLVVINPETKKLYLFKDGQFVDYTPLSERINKISDINDLLKKSSSEENIAVCLVE